MQNIFLSHYLFELQLVLAMGNYLNKGNARVDKASGFKVNFLTQVKTRTI